jgi:hypothetical protein
MVKTTIMNLKESNVKYGTQNSLCMFWFVGISVCMRIPEYRGTSNFNLARLMKRNKKLSRDEKEKVIVHIIPDSFIEHEKIIYMLMRAEFRLMFFL